MSKFTKQQMVLLGLDPGFLGSTIGIILVLLFQIRVKEANDTCRKSELLGLAEIYSYRGKSWERRLKDDNELRFLQVLRCIIHLDFFCVITGEP